MLRLHSHSKSSNMKRVLYLIAAGIFGIVTTEIGVIGLLPHIATHYTISIAKAGWLLSAFALVIAFFAPFVVFLIKQYNRRKLLLLVMVVFTLANVLSAFAPNFYTLLIIRAIPAFFHPVFWSIGLSFASATAQPGKAARGVSIVFGGFTLASVVSVPLATFIAGSINWQAAFLLFALFNAIPLIGLWKWLPDFQNTIAVSKQSPLTLFRKKTLWLNLVTALFMIAAMFSTYGYSAAFLEEVTLLNDTQISLLLLVFGLTGMLGNWVAGMAMSHHKRTTTLVFILLLALIHVLIYGWGNVAIAMVILLIFWGFIHTAGFLISNITVTSSAPEHQEFINSIFTSCGNLAVTLGSFTGGLWITHFGLEALPLSSIVLLGIALLAVMLQNAK